MTGDIYRDVVPSDQTSQPGAQAGRAYIAVIGIDRYHTWHRLYNAVSDASAALRLFTGLGFELVGPPLFDEDATGDALRRLVVDDLSGLGSDDSLVLFFAGHGHTMTRSYGGTSVKDGYLIPVDGDRPGGRAATWIRLESWLTEITRIPAKHILVVLDACHSGLALGPILQWRSRGMEMACREPLEQLRARRSRRIITSALDDQLAMDGGPVPEHSLFTGCLIEAMTGGLAASTGRRVVTGSEIGYYVQRRVSEYPGSVQTPDFGALELDDRGELLIRVAMDVADVDRSPSPPAASTVEGLVAANKLNAPDSERPSGLAVDALSGISEQHPPIRMRGFGPWLGGVIVIAIGGIFAAVSAMLDAVSVERTMPALSGPRDAGTAILTTVTDASSVVTFDALHIESSGSLPKAEIRSTTNRNRKSVQPAEERHRPKVDGRDPKQPHKGKDHASSSGSDTSSINSQESPTMPDAPSIDDRDD